VTEFVKGKLKIPFAVVVAMIVDPSDLRYAVFAAKTQSIFSVGPPLQSAVVQATRFVPSTMSALNLPAPGLLASFMQSASAETIALAPAPTVTKSPVKVAAVVKIIGAVVTQVIATSEIFAPEIVPEAFVMEQVCRVGWVTIATL